MGQHRQKLILAAVGGVQLLDSQARLQRPIVPRHIANDAANEPGAREGKAVASDLDLQRRATLRLRARIRLDRPGGLEIDDQLAVFSDRRQSAAELGIEQLHTVIVNGALSSVVSGERARFHIRGRAGINRRRENTIPARCQICFTCARKPHVYPLRDSAHRTPDSRKQLSGRGWAVRAPRRITYSIESKAAPKRKSFL